MNDNRLICVMGTVCVLCLAARAEVSEVCRLASPNGENTVIVSLTDRGCPMYRVERAGHVVIRDSSIGLQCKTENFSEAMALHEVGPVKSRRETYRLVVGNRLSVDSVLAARHVTFKTARDSFLTIDLVAGDEGIAFRCQLAGHDNLPATVMKEVTAFGVPVSAKAWLQPYHAAGRYTPAYEDFFFSVSPGDPPPRSRQTPRGWCLPGLFHLEAAQCWMLLAESGVDGSYCGCHLEEDASSKGRYQIAFAYDDEVTGARTFDPNARKDLVLTSRTPWRVIVLADDAGGILMSTLVTDVAAPCQIQDCTWIQAGRASWAWWSHPDGPTNQALFDEFTDLAAEFGWEYTLFDAGWWKTDLKVISSHAEKQSVKALAWTGAEDFFDPGRRKRKLDEIAGQGARGVKIDFWCSDRQETMAAMMATLKEAAARKLVVNFHGCTLPRGWHRTWPNLLTAEAVLGTESYFYESRYPERAAAQNTILPFTRNVMAPMDYTPVAITMRKYPRKTTSVHELATALAFTSGIIHYADSTERFRNFPDEVKQVLREAPAAWDETVCLIGDPGRLVVMARRTGGHWFIAGLNGTTTPQPVSLDLTRFGPLAEGIAITEGRDPLMQFSAERLTEPDKWGRSITPLGGFVLSLKSVN
ncbi:MAG: glycoside hydrolase family 97 protein [Phycisphaerae bacterium]|nr:glycoside hydrolase family 97 protein [Phycisphaerae bacterium]